VPKRIVLDIDDTFYRVQGGQQLRLFNPFHNDYGFQPIVVFDGEGRLVTALLRRLIVAVCVRWPQVEILVRGDSHYTAPEVLDWCRANRVDFILGLAPNSALHRHVAELEGSTAERLAVHKTGRRCNRAFRAPRETRRASALRCSGSSPSGARCEEFPRAVAPHRRSAEQALPRQG